jgi:hypothetical protein
MLIFSSITLSKDELIPEFPTQFVLERATHLDFGPPSDFYELFVVHSLANKITVERITLTPAADKCLVPARTEAVRGSIDETVSTLFNSVNPCLIPEKDLHRELKRRKRQLVFSSVQVEMKVPCGSQTRLIRADILDGDMFGPPGNTPRRTSWTMNLLNKLDGAVGPGAMEKPIFPTLAAE